MYSSLGTYQDFADNQSYSWSKTISEIMYSRVNRDEYYLHRANLTIL